MKRLGIIADDLTGACDAGAEFAALGFSCDVCLNELGQSRASVRVLSTESRVCDEEEAGTAVRLACDAFTNDDTSVVYKKIDSAMRGNCRVEIDSAMDALKLNRAFIAPAFPEMDRRVKNGWLYVGKDPARSAFVPSILGTTATHFLPAGGPFPNVSDEQGLFVVDACTRAELREFANHYRYDFADSLVAGSAGLAAEIARLNIADAAPRGVEVPLRGGPWLVVAGSSHPCTLAQLETLRADTRVALVDFRARSSKPIEELLSEGGDALLVVDLENRSAEDLQILPEVLKQRAFAGLILTGGFTARNVCRFLGANAIRLIKTLLPGIPIGVLVDGVADGLPVITKSGGFGDPSTLRALLDYVAGVGTG